MDVSSFDERTRLLVTIFVPTPFVLPLHYFLFGVLLLFYLLLRRCSTLFPLFVRPALFLPVHSRRILLSEHSVFFVGHV